jgi:hypothetical protein
MFIVLGRELPVRDRRPKVRNQLFPFLAVQHVFKFGPAGRRVDLSCTSICELADSSASVFSSGNFMRTMGWQMT